jgi:hypothetical protein
MKRSSPYALRERRGRTKAVKAKKCRMKRKTANAFRPVKQQKGLQKLNI